MARTHKIQKAHEVYSRIKAGNHPAMSIASGTYDHREVQKWLESGTRHGNKRKAVATLKVKARRAERKKFRIELEE